MSNHGGMRVPDALAAEAEAVLPIVTAVHALWEKGVASAPYILASAGSRAKVAGPIS